MSYHRLSSKTKLKILQTMIGACFSLLPEDMKEVANQTGLSISTLRRIQSDRLTLNIHINTLVVLANAAGLSIQLLEAEATVVVKSPTKLRKL